MKRILLVFMFIGLATVGSQAKLGFHSNWVHKSSTILEQQSYCSPQDSFALELVNRSDVTFVIELTNTGTGTPYGPYIVIGDAPYYRNIQPGIYDIKVTPETMPANFFATVVPGCDDLIDGYPGSTDTIYCDDVTLNSSSDCSSSIITNTQWVGN